jgi:hypothetical protein
LLYWIYLLKLVPIGMNVHISLCHLDDAHKDKR